jgi:hypothetical protein
MLTVRWDTLQFQEMCAFSNEPDVQSVFLEWKIRLNWVTANGWQYYNGTRNCETARKGAIFLIL